MTRALFLYTLGRFGLFLSSSLLLWSAAGAAGFDFNGLPLLLGGLLLSSFLSLFLLKRPRARLSGAVAAKREAKVAELTARRAALGSDRSS